MNEFTTTGGDWVAFVKGFEATVKVRRWSEEEALRELPTVLDNGAHGGLLHDF